MEIIFILLPLSLLIAAVFLAAFGWSVRSGQFEDLDTPAARILPDESEGKRTTRQQQWRGM